MKIRIVGGRPPNFEAIAAVFPEAKRDGVIFTYGDTIYVAGTVAPNLSPALRAHEAMHSQRQAMIGGPALWWDRYLADADFRLKEELIAHRAEYGTVRQTVKDRNHVAQHLHQIASRLASKLYGNMMTLAEAKRALLA